MILRETLCACPPADRRETPRSPLPDTGCRRRGRGRIGIGPSPSLLSGIRGLSTACAPSRCLWIPGSWRPRTSGARCPASAAGCGGSRRCPFRSWSARPLLWPQTPRSDICSRHQGFGMPRSLLPTSSPARSYAPSHYRSRARAETRT